ncbi:MerR family DNA-binding protein [Streptomyces sp. AP-93]|uniref:MerR family DNA-binding protein n=1 Tax=Streptomyces sp. AP-93 TaxID=2929048 RepID=UPI0035B111E0
MLDLQRSGEQPCGLVTDLLDQHLADIDRRISDLQALRTTRRGARAQADQATGRGESAVVCRIIEGASAAS